METNEKQLDALTNQSVTIRLGGKEYTARRASLYDVGVYRKFRDQKEKEGDTVNLEMDSAYYLFATLIKDFDPEITPEKIAKSLLVENSDAITKEIQDALVTVGFKKPQSQATQT